MNTVDAWWLSWVTLRNPTKFRLRRTKQELRNVTVSSFGNAFTFRMKYVFDKAQVFRILLLLRKSKGDIKRFIVIQIRIALLHTVLMNCLSRIMTLPISVLWLLNVGLLKLHFSIFNMKRSLLFRRLFLLAIRHPLSCRQAAALVGMLDLTRSCPYFMRLGFAQYEMSRDSEIQLTSIIHPRR